MNVDSIVIVRSEKECVQASSLIKDIEAIPFEAEKA